jgi:hypothetical protein
MARNRYNLKLKMLYFTHQKLINIYYNWINLADLYKIACANNENWKIIKCI